MNRLFGTSSSSSKNKKEKPDLNATIESMDKRADGVGEKIRKIDQQLLGIRQQMSKMPNGPSKERLKSQAMKLLQQKKQYENQRNMMMDQSFNLEQTSFAVDSMKSTVETVEVMKSTSKELKRTMGAMKIGKVEDLRDEMEDLMMETGEINEILSRSYGVPEEIDDRDLEAELGMLGAEEDYESNLISGEAESSSSYLDILTTSSSNAIPTNGGGGGGGDKMLEQQPMSAEMTQH